MMISRRGVSVLVLTAVLFLQVPLSGQRESEDARLRNDCRLAVQVLETGQPSPHFGWAMETIRRCIETGGEALASVWARPPVDSASLNSLFFASYSLRDARITAAAITAASNGSLPQLVRLNALRVLVGHAVPSFKVSLTDLPPDLPPGVYRTMGYVSHAVVWEGDRQIGPETVDDIVDALARLQSDADPRIAGAAAYAYRQVSGRLRYAPR